MEFPHPELEIIKNEVFKPGNLVWGAEYFNLKRFQSLTETGILPAVLHKRGYAIRPDCVCMGLMRRTEPDSNPLHKYMLTTHFGPYMSQFNEPSYVIPQLHKFAVILDREKTLKDFGRHVVAIGESFSDPRLQQFYDYDESTQSVFGIPISSNSFSERRSPFVDEVVVNYPEDEMGTMTGITPQYWTGLVTADRFMTTIQQWLRESGVQNLPIFSPEGQMV